MKNLIGGSVAIALTIGIAMYFAGQVPGYDGERHASSTASRSLDIPFAGSAPTFPTSSESVKLDAPIPPASTPQMPPTLIEFWSASDREYEDIARTRLADTYRKAQAGDERAAIVMLNALTNCPGEPMSGEPSFCDELRRLDIKSISDVLGPAVRAGGARAAFLYGSTANDPALFPMGATMSAREQVAYLEIGMRAGLLEAYIKAGSMLLEPTNWQYDGPRGVAYLMLGQERAGGTPLQPAIDRYLSRLSVYERESVGKILLEMRQKL